MVELIVRRADAQREIAALKRQSGKDILVFGSHTLWDGLLSAGLVDELHLMPPGASNPLNFAIRVKPDPRPARRLSG